MHTILNNMFLIHTIFYNMILYIQSTTIWFYTYNLLQYGFIHTIFYNMVLYIQSCTTWFLYIQSSAIWFYTCNPLQYGFYTYNRVEYCSMHSTLNRVTILIQSYTILYNEGHRSCLLLVILISIKNRMIVKNLLLFHPTYIT